MSLNGTLTLSCIAMRSWVALLRGINVGGKHILPMRELVQMLEDLHLKDVRTYIQSGNVLFRSDHATLPDDCADRIAAVIEHKYGFRPHVLVISAAAWTSAVASNPFPRAEYNPKTLHLYFLASAPTEPDFLSLEKVKAPNEAFHLAGDVFYLHAPNGIGRSKLAARVERALGVPATARNWRTVQKLHDLLHQNIG